MARPAKSKTGEEQSTKAAPSLSLSETQAKIDADKAATMERILETAPTPAPLKAETPPAPTEEPQTPEPQPGSGPEELTPERYMAWFDAQPLEMRAAFAGNVKGARDNELAQMWGPEVVEVLKEVQDDPKLAKIFKALTAKEKRAWLADTALDIYEDPKYAPEPDEGAPDPKYAALEEKVSGLQETLTKAEQTKAVEAYQAERRDEYVAFQAKFPQLNYDPTKVRFSADGSDVMPAPGVEKNDPDFKRAKRAFAIVNRAEEQSRKVGRKISYADVGVEMMDMWDAQESSPPPRPIPSTSNKEVPSPQAPRTKVEVRRGMTEQLAKHGNVSNLARALRS